VTRGTSQSLVWLSEFCKHVVHAMFGKVQCIGITFHTIIIFHTNRKSLSFLPRLLQKLFYNIAHASSIFAQSLKVLQSFDEAGYFQEWCEKCTFVWSNFLHGIYYILRLTNQLKFVTTIIVHDFGTNHSLTERKLEQNSVIQTVYNCKAMKFDLHAGCDLISHGRTSCNWLGNTIHCSTS
jgi:hypothetical protein